ncbi:MULTISPECIES: diaminopimelate decarboxylase [unclassified Spirosoma]|uniref:diaminopimelate decarboxylase n=1 Tax=unclassified Spirosoma TaxID=2621999 RepID=UPI000966CAC1|nr:MULTISPECIES: diaminopimelate decarboxylase [unclassified Spirosoma]MBN8826452.1 diaminopimelate decarboxylase [Spirosoma sp.]OJW75841.1 MAG: diaminopimelate decarboxylase [Spirosoma sp. 48-14]
MQLNNQVYQIQGVDVLAIADEFGLPLYVYDADKIIEKIGLLRSAFAGVNLKIKYAAKALTNVSILKLMRQQGVEMDSVSVNEARMGMLAGFTPNQIMFTPSGVSFGEIREAIELGLQLNVDSLPLLEWVGQNYGSQVPVSIRINPHISEGGNIKISTGHADSKFGISILQRAEMRALVEKYQISVTGLHVHTGSDFKNADAFLKGADVLFDLASDYPDLTFIDFGSGFKVAYKEGDHVTDVVELGNQVSAAFQKFCQHYGRELELWFEPGKFLVSESGHLLVRTNIVKENPTRTFVAVDSGLNHLIRPMMYDAYHDIKNISNPAGEPKMYTVVGYICETDTFATDRVLPEVRPGDVLSFENAGAYGFSMSSNYNARFRPAEVLVYEGKPYLIRQRETFEDLMRGQEIIEFESTVYSH